MDFLRIFYGLLFIKIAIISYNKIKQIGVDMATRKQGKYNQEADRFFGDLKSFGTSVITDTIPNVDAKTAEQVSNELAYRLSQHWGGSMFYVTKKNAWQAHKRDMEIWDAFTGNNHHELVQKFGLSLPYIYEILARMRKIGGGKQKDLFINED